MAETSERKQRITLVESDEPLDVVRRSMPGENLVEVDMFVRRPDKPDLEELAVTARLCSCRRVCVAIIEQ